MGRTVSEVEALLPGLATKKENIRQAIIAQGVDVPANATVSDYAAYILQIVHIVDSVTITSATSLSPSYTSTTYTINFTTSGTSNWSIASNQTWCTFNTSSGSTTGSHSVTLTVAANGSGGSAARSATITITCGTATGTISVSQAMNTSDITINYLQQNTTQQHIDLGRQVTQRMKIEIKFVPSATGEATSVIFGCYTNSTTTTGSRGVARLLFTSKTLYLDNPSDGIMRVSQSATATTTYYVTWQLAQSRTAIGSNNYYYGISTSSQPSASTGKTDSQCYGYSPNKNAYIMGCNGSYTNAGVGHRLYYFKLYDSSNKLIMNLTPVRHYINGAYKPCMKDSVSGNYYYGSNSSVNFLYG